VVDYNLLTSDAVVYFPTLTRSLPLPVPYLCGAAPLVLPGQKFETG